MSETRFRSEQPLLFTACTGLVIISLLGCTSDHEFIIDIDGVPEDSLTFDQLPENVRAILDSNITLISKATSHIWFSCDPKDAFVYARTARADSWLAEVRSQYGHFFVEGFHYRIEGHVGDPVIYCDGLIYYSSGYVRVDNFKTEPYFRRRLPVVH